MGAGDLLKAAGLCLALGACAPQSKVAYLEQVPLGVEDARELDRPFEETWNKLAANLPNGFFVMDSMEKASQVIELSFRSDDPGSYIDCGYLLSDYASLSGAKEQAQISVTDNAEFGLYRDNGGTMSVTWRTGLQGRATIFVVPYGERTSVSVLIKYVFVVRATYQSYNVLKSPLGAPATETTVTRFDTNKASRGQASGKTVTCFTKGVLEQRILDAAT